MLLALKLAVGVLVAVLAIMVVYATATGWVVRLRERADYRQRCRERDARHASKPVKAIHAEDWEGPPTNFARFKRIWTSLASHLEIDPELMRPSDRVADIMVSTEHYGVDSDDLIDFFLEFLPRSDPDEVLQEVAGDESESVGDLVRAVVVRQQ